MAGPIDRFDEAAKLALALAQNEAVLFHHDYIGPEHLLLGVLREGRGVGARTLTSLGVDVTRARRSVELLDGRGDSNREITEIVLTPESKKAFQHANAEASALGRERVATEHFLLGILREPGRAEAVLASFGVSLEAARSKVMETLRGPEM